jgi:hypothetical protein
MRAVRAGLVALLATICATPVPAPAVEYRLRVANLDDSAYFHFARRDGHDTESPFVLPRLEGALEQGTLPGGVFVSSRALLAVDTARARSFGAADTRQLAPSPGAGQWQEVRWDGTAGQRAVWVVHGEGTVRQGVVGVGLRGPKGDLRHYIPWAPGPGDWRVRAARLGLDFVDFWYGRDGLWGRYLGPRLDLASGIAAVVAENPNTAYADSVFLVVQQPSTPTTYDVVIAWRHRTRGHFNPYYDVGGQGGADADVR